MALVATKNITTKAHSDTIFAAKMLGKLMGSGIRMVKSRRSGNSASHSRTVTNPITAMENVMKNILSERDAASATLGGTNTNMVYLGISQKQIKPGAASNPMTLLRVACTSPCVDTSSLSKNRPKKCRISTPNRSRIGPHDFNDVVGPLFGVLLHHQLREDLFERRKLHQVAEDAEQVANDIV